MNGVLKPFYGTCRGLGDLIVWVEGVLDQVRRFIQRFFSWMRDIKFQPDMLQESFWAPWICIFTPNNFLFCHFALTWTLVCDLDSLENGTGEIHVVNISCMDEWSPLLSKWHEVLSIFIMQSLKHLRPCQKIFCKKIHTQTEQCCSTTPSWRSGRWRPSCSSSKPWWA